MKLKPIHEQVAVVFGASSGIGRQTAIDFARRGARVVVAARSREGLDSLVETIHSSGGKAIAKQADAADFEQVRAVAEEAVREFGHLDTWVHAAAVSLYARFEDTDPEEFRRVIEVNLVGQAYGARAALPHLRRKAAAPSSTSPQWNPSWRCRCKARTPPRNMGPKACWTRCGANWRPRASPSP